MRILKEILQSAESGIMPTQTECYYAFLATEYLRKLSVHLTRMGIHSISLNITDKAMNMCPKRFLGPNCPNLKDFTMTEIHFEDKRLMLNLYNERLKKGATDEQIAGMGPLENQNIRFEAFLKMGDFSDATVLDIGCGQGGFLEFCKRRNPPMPILYTGIDLVPKLIEEARIRHPDATFMDGDVLGNVLETYIPPQDFIIANGAFNFRFSHGNNYEVVEAFLSKCFPLAKKALAVSLMSTWVDYQTDLLYYYDPAEMFRFAKTLTKRVILRHDLPIFDFILFLYQDE